MDETVDGTTVALTVRASKAWIDGSWRSAAIDIADDRIVAVRPLDRGDDAPRARTVDIADDTVLLPGLVDSHVHCNEPGRTEWEGFASATLAAAAAGVSRIVDMPLNSIPATTTVEALEAKRAATEGKLAVDVGFWGGAVPENLGSLGGLHEAGVFGFKCFLAPSGVDEFGHLDRAQLALAMDEIADLGSVLIVHAEDAALLGANGPLGTDYSAFLASRPPASEESAIAAVIAEARRSGARAHILHLSDAGSLPMLRAAKQDGVRITVETCPHYLSLEAESIPAGASAFKCCPPIREHANRELLWEAVLDGTIDAIVSDHSPSTVEQKTAGGGDWGLAWGGISGLQLGFRAVWTEAKARGIAIDAILPAFTTGPARVAAFEDAPRIACGERADLVVFSPTATSVVDARSLAHKHPITAYDGAELAGEVVASWLRGKPLGPGADRAGIMLSAR